MSDVWSNLGNENDDVLGGASDWLESQRHQHRTRQAAYRRGTKTIAIRATVGRTQFELTDDHGTMQRIESVDFIVRAGDLQWPVEGRPQAGDRIITRDGLYPPDDEEPDRGLIREYEVLSLPGVPCWRYSDPNMRSWRVHTKLVKEYVGTVIVEETIP
jgi:hypothetical protein